MKKFVEGNTEDKYHAYNPISQLLMKRFLISLGVLIKKLKSQKKIVSICEVGCGEGELLKIIRFYFPDADIFACDLSLNEIEKAKKNCKSLNIHFSVQNAEMLNYKDKAFDLVICCEVLEHLDQPQKGLSEIKRVGKFAIVSVPIEPLWRFLNIMRFKYLNEFGNTPGHLNHWSIKNMKRFFSEGKAKLLIDLYPYPWQIYLLGL